MGGKRWSDEEETVIVDIANSGIPLAVSMHLLPGRTYEGAKTHASKIGVRLSEAKEWTPRERVLLKRIYASSESIKRGVRRLLPLRGYLAAKGEAQRLGLTGTKTRHGRDGYSWVEQAIEAALEDGVRMTVKQLTVKTGASLNAVNKIMAKKRGKKFRAGDWTRASNIGNWAALWELGSGPDAPRPARKTATESCRKWRNRRQIRAGQIDPFASLIQQVSA